MFLRKTNLLNHKSVNIMLISTQNNIYLKQGLSDKALENYRQSLYICERINPTNPSFTKKIRHRMCKILVPTI